MNEALKMAYELERKGLDFYIGSAVESKNTLVKRTLFSLAQEEIKHMMKIDEISLSLDNSGKWPDAEVGFEASDIETGIREFFKNTDKGLLNEHSDNIDAVKKAMEFERRSFDLYADLGKKAKSDSERLFYDELKKQEESHFDALQNVCYYLAKTGDWFEKEESGAWNWMNT